MKYAPPVYKQCCHCQNMLTIRPLLEANARNAVLWTDGYVDSPMIAEQPLVAKCGHCAGIVWLAELLMHPEQDPDKAKDYSVLNLDEQWGLLDEPSELEYQHQLYLRVKLWHASNHRLRHNKEAKAGYAERERNNLIKLGEILNVNEEHDRILAAELMRELGRFDEAAQLLNVHFSDLVQPIADQLQHLVKSKTSRVVECTPPTYTTMATAVYQGHNNMLEMKMPLTLLSERH